MSTRTSDTGAATAAANREVFVQISGPRSGRQMEVREHTYGVLVPDSSHPLSCVSVSNSSLSIDLWTGCSYQCAYCHVQGTLQDLTDDLAMAARPSRRSPFTVDEILDALVEHPFFVAHESVISIGTASTEPFVPGEITDSTFEIIEKLQDRGFRNPIWIVTKAGVPKGRREQLAKAVAGSRNLLISICWADNPKEIEPAVNDRFRHVAEAVEAGATISWYLRPLVVEWGANLVHLRAMFTWLKDKGYARYIHSVVPGGLRWTEGIEYGLTEVRALPMPNIPKDDNVKDLPEEVLEGITELAAEFMPGVPVYRKSSCALSEAISVPSITSVQTFAAPDCQASACPLYQRKLCEGRDIRRLTAKQAQGELDRLGIPARVTGVNQGFVSTEPPLGSFTYAIQRTYLKALAALDPK